MKRQATVERKTSEVNVKAFVNLDGTGQSKISTGVGFLDHMLSHIALHGIFDLDIEAKGDLHIDTHHTMEDVGITLGQAFHQAIEDKAGIRRIGHAYVPMDEALAFVAIDFSNRPFWVIEVPWNSTFLGNGANIIPVTLIEHFLQTFTAHARVTLHARVMTGRNDHHMAEALFKALGRALDQASRVDHKLQGQIPSTKGILREK